MLFFLVLALYIGGVGSLHPRNAFQGSYDMSRLAAASPALRPHIIPASSPRSKSGRATIDFADAAAVRALNQALLKADYGVEGWILPPNKLCPPVPGRADYVHVLADTLANSAGGSRGIPSGGKVVGLDVGTGSSAIYALIGVSCCLVIELAPSLLPPLADVLAILPLWIGWTFAGGQLRVGVYRL
jgi:hypothetical protein